MPTCFPYICFLCILAYFFFVLLSFPSVVTSSPKESTFFELAEFSANCQLANNWTCFVEHKTLTPFSLTCQASVIAEVLATKARGLGDGTFVFKKTLLSSAIWKNIKLILKKHNHFYCRISVDFGIDLLGKNIYQMAGAFGNVN